MEVEAGPEEPAHHIGSRKYGSNLPVCGEMSGESKLMGL